MSVTDPEFTSPDSNVSPYAHAVRHLDQAKDSEEEDRLVRAQARALIGIGWALLAIARKR